MPQLLGQASPIKTLKRFGAMPCTSCPYIAAAKGLVRKTRTLALRQGTLKE